MGDYKEVYAREQELMKKHGFIVHAVYETIDGNEYNGLCNVHTHGLLENYGHKDLQIVLPLSPEQNHQLISYVAHQIMNENRVFEPDVVYSDVLSGGYKIMFRVYKEHDREVLRLLLPDKEGFLPTDEKCDPFFKRQLEDIE